MAALNDLPAEILHQIAELCSKADLLSLRLTFWRLYNFLSLYVDKHLASEVRSGTHTHLHRAVATSDDYGGIILARLLNVSAPVDQRDKNSETALHVAFRVGNINGLTRTLLDFGADAKKPGRFGWTALHYAIQNGHTDCTRVLATDTIVCQKTRHITRAKQQWGVYRFSAQL
ncbi:ankyrin repeat-containing domain protein [Aspergillus avenaceus]|uniref:Ankyrin repeat-containing domain protein n=1 Tax=Aspergillus avenaceus TaxID=36643 RepID=A0A5N6U8X8_ASPAV|nr:ankyrin repeat-containing domain protein [Aspergillus avenaceus]